MTDLRGKRALVTGGTSGIGRGIVERLTGDGASVVFTGRDEGRGSEVEAATGAGFVRADASDPAAVEASAAEALRMLGGLDVLVNNAGFVRDRMFVSTSEEEWDAVVRVHLKGHSCVSRHATAHWRERAFPPAPWRRACGSRRAYPPLPRVAPACRNSRRHIR